MFQGKHYGTIFGTLSLASIVGGAIGPGVAGALHDYTGSYVLAFWIAIGASIVSAVAMWLAAPRKVRAVAGRVPAVDKDCYFAISSSSTSNTSVAPGLITGGRP